MGTRRAVLLVRHGQDRADRGIAALTGRAEGPVEQLAHRARRLRGYVTATHCTLVGGET